jgi:arylsulfatase A-like enzyme
MWYCRAWIVLLALLGSTGATVAIASAAQRQPNVLFLFTDDQRPDTIAALGNPAIKTPNLDALVQRGFTFRNAYCMGSTMGAVCNPSRHMMLSGMSLYRYRPAQVEGTFGDVMRKAGYVTYHQSKRGNEAHNYHKAFEYSSYLNDSQERASGHHGRAAADNAIEFLGQTWDRGKPLFMYIGFAGPHDPRVAAKQWMDLYRPEEIPLPPNYKPFHPIDNGWMTGRDEKLAPWPRTEEVVRKHLHDYYACISSIDHHIGRILAKLQELGEYENTIVIFSSDHGLAIGSHGLFGKQNLYEHSMGAPLVFAGPGIPRGQSDALVYLFDIFPTVADLVGAKTPDTLDGRSLAPVMRGDRQAVRDTVFLAFEQGQRAVRRGDWKLYRFPLVNHTMLFNLREDPHELNDLASDPQHAQRAREMMALLAEQQKLYGDPHPHTSDNPRPAQVDLTFFGAAK